jgi:hypothetical protein
MRRRTKAGLAVAAIAAAIPVASVLGRGVGQSGDPGQTASKAVATETAAVHRVAAPTLQKAGARHRHRSAVKLAYFETKRKTVPKGKTDLLVGPVPKRCFVLNGYYFIYKRHTTDVLSMGDSPAGLRKWDFYRDNETGKPVRHVTYGVICARGVGVITR